MNYAEYRDAIDWIAFNDEYGSPHALDKLVVKDQLTVQMVADVFKVPAVIVARDVIKARKREQTKELSK